MCTYNAGQPRQETQGLCLTDGKSLSVKNFVLSPDGDSPGGGTPSLKVVGRLPGTHGLKSLWAPKKGGQNSMCCRRAKKNRGQKSICGHKKGGQYSMSHWKIGVKILCVVLKRGSIFYGSLKAKIWGSKFYLFLVEPLVKILCSLKRGVKILYFFPVPWKRGVKTAEPTNQLHWRGAPPGGTVNFLMNREHFVTTYIPWLHCLMGFAEQVY